MANMISSLFWFSCVILWRRPISTKLLVYKLFNMQITQKFGAISCTVLKIYGGSQDNIFCHQAFRGKTTDA